MALVGAIYGAVGGFVLWTWICLRLNTYVIGIHCFVSGISYGVLLGAVVGGALAVALHKSGW